MTDDVVVPASSTSAPNLSPVNESTTKDDDVPTKTKVKKDKKLNECRICTSPQEIRTIKTFSKNRSETATFLNTQIQISAHRGWLYVCKKCLSIVELIMRYNKRLEKLQEKISQLTQGLKLKADITKLDFDNIPDVDAIINEHFECVTLDDEAEKETKAPETTLFEDLNQSKPKPIVNDAESYNNEMDPMDDHFMDNLMAQYDSEPEMTPIIPPKPKDNRIRRNLNSRYYRLTRKTCPICQKVMDPNNFKRHFRRVHEKATRFTCPTCGYKSYQKTNHEQHLKSCAQGKHCDKCGKVFAKLGILARHIRNVHSEAGKIKAFLCDQCPQSFAMQCHLSLHIKKKHANGNEVEQQTKKKERSKALKQFKCQVCGKILSSKFRLEYHQARLCGNDKGKKKKLEEYKKKTQAKKKFKCDECGQKLVTELGLQRHKERRGKHGPRKRAKKNKKNVKKAVDEEEEEEEQMETDSEEDEEDQIQSVHLQQQSVQTRQQFFQPVTYSFPLPTNQYPNTQPQFGYRYN